MWKKKIYFENTNFLLKDANLILIKKIVRFFFFFRCRSDFYLEKMQIRFYKKQSRFLFGKFWSDFIKNRENFYLKKYISDFLLKIEQIFIWKKCRFWKNADQIFFIKNRADFYLEKMQNWFFLIKNRLHFIWKKMLIWFYFEKETKKKNTDLTLNEKYKYI